VSSKQTKKNFGSNRNKPKLDLFRLIFGLFRETNKTFFWLFRFVSVFRIRIEITETNATDSKQTKKNKKIQKKQKKNIFCILYCVANNSMKEVLYINPNPHCFIAITKATACGWKEPLLPHPLHSPVRARGKGKGGGILYGPEDLLNKNVSYT
jgi:hypothetical protein